MPHYTFEGLSAGGEQITGTLDATSRGDAYRQIESRQLVPIHVAEKTEAVGRRSNNGAAASADVDEGVLRLKQARLIFFTSELADLLDAGLPVQQALNVMADRQQDPVIRRTGA